MKIDAEKFRQFIRRATLDGDALDATFYSEPAGLHAAVAFQDMVIVDAKLAKEAFEEYVPFDQPVSIPDTNGFKKALDGFEGSIELRVDRNLFIVETEKKLYKFIMVDKEFITTDAIQRKFDSLIYDAPPIPLSTELFRDTARNCRNFAKDASKVIIECKDGTVSFSMDAKKNQFTERQKLVVPRNGKIAIGAKLFLQVVGFETRPIIEGDVSMLLKDEKYPLTILENSGHGQYKYIVAPIVQEEG